MATVDAGAVDPSGAMAASISRRMVLLSRAIYYAALSALATAALLIGAFVAALAEIGHARFVALMFAVFAHVADGLARRADPRDSRPHGEHASRMIAANSPVPGRSLGNPGCAGYIVGNAFGESATL